MDEKKAKKLADAIFEDVFGVKNPFTLKKLQEKFAFDIPLPSKVKCSLSGKTTWSFSAEASKFARQEAIAERFKKDSWMQEKKSINSIEDILKYWREINYITAEKNINSKEVAESDGVYNSLSVFKSVSIFNSKNILFSYKIFDSSYLLASRDSSSCSFGIRIKDSLYCSSSFEVSWSSKVSRSMFIHDCYDLYECLFCSHIRSKKYCIANMQFSKEEYFKIKKKVIEWIVEKNND